MGNFINRRLRDLHYKNEKCPSCGSTDLMESIYSSPTLCKKCNHVFEVKALKRDFWHY